ncbi:hypothetical protein [Streptomyces sp. NPDC059564]|uniref:hypothetical protein n=1 Tax=Streptomyces sp. NPDC059564 TaxID=3346865 RepID=UPI0036AE8162
MNRRTRLILLAPALAGSLVLGPAALAGASAPAAVPAASCSLSGVLPDGTVRLSGGGFKPGAAFLDKGSGPAVQFNMSADGSFAMEKMENVQYTVRQGNEDTKCSGGSEMKTGNDTGTGATGTTAKAGIVAGWDAVKGNCAAKAPASGNKQFTQGWNKGASVAREAFC